MKRIEKILVVFFFIFCLSSSDSWAREEKIQHISVQGNRKIEAAAILEAMQSRPKASLEKSKVQEDIRRIFRMGYFKDVSVYFDPKSETLMVRVKEKPTIREIQFSGNKSESTEDLKTEIQLKSFVFFDENRMREDVEKIRQYYDGKGFYLVEISPEVETLSEAEVNVKFVIHEAQKIKIRRISFLGNKVFSDSELKEILRTQEKGFFSFLSGSGSYEEEFLSQDREILREFYGHKGYIRAKIGTPRVQLSPDKKTLSVTFSIEEGDRYHIGQVEMDGVLIKERDELEKNLTLKEGELADTFKIHQDIAKLSSIYADEGYAYVNVIPRDRYDEEKKIVDITYFLQPGDVVYVEKISFLGNSSTRDKILRREMQIAEGEKYHSTKIRESKENIERLALFEEVKMTTPRGSADDRVDIVVEVKERQTGSFSLGAGFNTLESFQVMGRIEKRNLFGYGVDLSFDARFGGRTQAFNLEYRDENFMDTRWGLTVDAFKMNRQYSNFDLNSKGFSLGFDYPLYVKALKRIRAGITYSLVDQDLTDLRSTIENLFHGGITSSVTTSISRDTRNRVFEPSKGSFLKVSEEIAGGPFGGENSFSKTEFDGRWFFPVVQNPRIPFLGGSVFGLHLNLGYVAPLKDGERVPLFERYFPGGILSLRGFDLRSLGPEIQVASSNDPTGFTTSKFVVGGNKEIIFNAEYMFPIIAPANIKGVLFFDMGNAFDNGESMWTLTGQRQSVGFGIRWFSPMGPLRFEWGIPLDKKKDESRIVFDFMIGSMF